MVRFENGGGESPERVEGLAPVIPLFGGQQTSTPARLDGHGGREPARWQSTWGERAAPAPAPEDDAEDDDTVGVDPSAERERAEKVLLKRLRMRSLSVKEARAVLSEHELDDAVVETLIEEFLSRGYLDDEALAEQLIHAGVDRKGQGRGVLAQTLAKRGIPRDVAGLALEALPDDDAMRAMEFARTKARQLDSVDEETAVRRLMGQLARRGYPGSVASKAARDAVREHRRGPRGGGVRFV